MLIANVKSDCPDLTLKWALKPYQLNESLTVRTRGVEMNEIHPHHAVHLLTKKKFCRHFDP